uniref:fatty acid desaturase n=1 Tax=Vulcanococcus sp. TaxID=2856995 RepID=UPI0037DA66F6
MPAPVFTPPSAPNGAHRAAISPPARAAHLHRPRNGADTTPHHGTPDPEARRVNGPVLGFMVALHALALVALLPQFWSLPALATLLVLYWITACLGVTIGYHRLLSHRALRVPRWLERCLATCGALSCQHGPIDWVGLHRHHHKFSDTDADHHNSHRGFWWSHLGWMLETVPAQGAVARLTGDLAADPYYRWLNRRFLL